MVIDNRNVSDGHEHLGYDGTGIHGYGICDWCGNEAPLEKFFHFFLCKTCREKHKRGILTSPKRKPKLRGEAEIRAKRDEIIEAQKIAFENGAIWTIAITSAKIDLLQWVLGEKDEC